MFSRGLKREEYSLTASMGQTERPGFAEAERYIEEADQAGLAEDAVIKLEGYKANSFTQTPSAGLGKAPKIKAKSE
jgi:hypothetical protein